MSESPSLRNQGALRIFLGDTDLHSEPTTHWNDAGDESIIETAIVTEQGEETVILSCLGGEVKGVAELLRSIADNLVAKSVEDGA